MVVGWLVFRAVRAVLPRRTTSVAPAAAIGAFVSVPVAAMAYTGIYAVGGTAPVPLDALFTAMVGWHLLIGLGEAAITALVVGSVVAVRPDLVHGARPSLAIRELEIRTAVARVTTKRFLALGLLVAFVLVAAASLWSSGRPDGLERVAEDTGMLGRAEHTAALDLGGVAGLLIVMLLAGALFWTLRRREAPEPADRDRA